MADSHNMLAVGSLSVSVTAVVEKRKLLVSSALRDSDVALGMQVRHVNAAFRPPGSNAVLT